MKYFVIFPLAFVKLVDQFTILIPKSRVSSTSVGNKGAYWFWLGYNFDAQACFRGLFLCTLCITQSASFKDPHLMTWICQLQYPSENNSVHLQGKSSFHKSYIPFFGKIWLLLLIWIIIMVNWFYHIIIPEFCSTYWDHLSKTHVFLDIFLMW